MLKKHSLWPYHSQCLGWYLWLLTPPKAMQMPGIWTVTWGQGWSEGHATVGTAQIWVASIATTYHGDIKPMLQLRAISRSVTLLQPGSVLMSITHDAIKGYANARDLGCYLGHVSVQVPHFHWSLADWSSLPPEAKVTSKPRPCWCCRAMLPPGHTSLSGMCCHLGPWCLLLRAMSGSVAEPTTRA